MMSAIKGTLEAVNKMHVAFNTNAPLAVHTK